MNPWTAASYIRIVDSHGRQLGVVWPAPWEVLGRVPSLYRIPTTQPVTAVDFINPGAPPVDDPHDHIVEVELASSRHQRPLTYRWCNGPLDRVERFLPLESLPLPSPRILVEIDREKLRRSVDTCLLVIGVELGVIQTN